MGIHQHQGAARTNVNRLAQEGNLYQFLTFRLGRWSIRRSIDTSSP